MIKKTLKIFNKTEKPNKDILNNFKSVELLLSLLISKSQIFIQKLNL